MPGWDAAAQLADAGGAGGLLVRLGSAVGLVEMLVRSGACLLPGLAAGIDMLLAEAAALAWVLVGEPC